MYNFKQFFLFIFLLAISNPTNSFDWEYYVNNYSDVKNLGIHTWLKAWHHFVHIGMKEGRKSVPEDFDNTNFDWEYYIKKNELNHIKSETEAIKHYQKIGSFGNLPYCKQFTIVILLHLYDLKQTDSFIEKINNFIKTNNLNNFYIKINIPVDKNIDEFAASNIMNENSLFDLVSAKKLAPYHPELISKERLKIISKIQLHILNNVDLPNDNIQVIFSENRGQDIGGFFIMMDQLIKENLKHDFIIKLHSKRDKVWSNVLSSFLNVKINKLLRKKECVYSNKLYFDYKNANSISSKNNLVKILNYLNLPKLNFNFCGGTMFIASRKFTNFFRNYDPKDIFDMLNNYAITYGENYPKDGLIEHAFERFFGYVFDYLKLKTQILDYYPFKPLNEDHQNSLLLELELALEQQKKNLI